MYCWWSYLWWRPTLVLGGCILRRSCLTWTTKERTRPRRAGSLTWAVPYGPFLKKGLNSQVALAEVPWILLYNVVQWGEGRVVVDTCHKVWVGLTMMKHNVCHLSVSVLGWGGNRVGCRVEEGVDGRQRQKWRQLKFPPVCSAWPLLLSLFNLTSCLRCGGWKWRGAAVVV